MDYYATLARWQELKLAITKLQEEERALRDGLFTGTFPKPTEGVNKSMLPDGREVKGTYKLNRTVLQDAVPALPATLRKMVFKTTYELKLAEYRKLDKASQKTVDKALTVKPGLPTLEIKAAKQDTPTLQGK